ncbi:MAG: Flp pilus assembly protein TadB [Microbacterium sp.]|nr:Flp pilus assembly protein TadB [Microbacterium sp.]
MIVRNARRRPRRPDPLETILRLAVLMSAGLGTAAAWRYVADDGGGVVREAADAAAAGDDVASVLRRGGDEWLDVAAVWAVAVAVGAPLADTLREMGTTLREARDIADDVRVSLAEPLATARLLAGLPLVGVPLGMALGFDTVRVLTTDPIGRCCLGAGLALVTVARVWSRRLARRATPSAEIPGMTAELFAVALSAGASIERARALIHGERDDEFLLEDDDDRRRVEATLELSVRAGVPAGELLRGDAWLARRSARTRGREAAATLSTRLLLPLGACTLPAFLLLAVAPLMIGVLRSGVSPL